MRLLSTAVLGLLIFGGCSRKVTIEDLEGLQVRTITQGSAGEIHGITADEVVKICGKPDKEFLAGNGAAAFLFFAYAVDEKEYFLRFEGSYDSDHTLSTELVQSEWLTEDLLWRLNGLCGVMGVRLPEDWQ